jgi:hypothetical protein
MRARRFVPYAVRVAYAEEGRAQHRVSVRRSPLRGIHSFLREVGDVLWGAFAAEAV